MRKCLPLLLVMLGFLGGCKDDKAPVLNPINDVTYTGEKLVLYYNGEPMPNKSATIVQNGDKATLKLFAEFDLSQLSAFGLSGSIPAPGALPGIPVTTIDLKMSNGGEYWNFNGSGETSAVTFNYKGYANSEQMAMFLSDVSLKTGGLTPEVWQPAPLKQTDGEFTSLPFFIDWEYDPIPDVDFNLSPYLKMLTTIPIIPVYNNTAYMSISQAVSLLLQTVAFRPDGNMILTYISSVGGASHLAQTLPNRFLYLPLSKEKVNLYLNPTALFGMLLMAGSTGVPSDDIKIIGNGIYPSGHVTETTPGILETISKSEMGSKIAKAALSVILPKIADGLPFDVLESDGQLHLCLDTPVAIAILQEIAGQVLSDSEIVKALEAYIEGNANLKPLLPLLSKALQLLPEAIERTNRLEIGLALIPYSR